MRNSITFNLSNGTDKYAHVLVLNTSDSDQRKFVANAFTDVQWYIYIYIYTYMYISNLLNSVFFILCFIKYQPL